MLDIFIIHTNSPVRDLNKLRESFSLKDICFHDVTCISEINYLDKQNPWYFVIYDNEFLSEDLADSLQTYIELGTEQFYTMYRICLIDNDLTKSKISVAPRMFRKDIKLLNNCLCPECGFPVGRSNHVLDGFIRGNE